MHKYKYLFLSAAAIFLGILHFSQEHRQPSVFQDRFHQLTDTMFQKEITSSTLNLHYTLQYPENYGITSYPITYLPQNEISLVTATSSAEDYQYILQQIPYDSLSKDDQLTYDILSLALATEKYGEPFFLYNELLSPTTGIQAQLPVLLAEYTFYRKEDISTYLNLITQTDEYFSVLLEFEQEKSKAGLFMNQDNVHKILAQCQSILQMSEDENFLLTIFNEKVHAADYLTNSEKQNYISQNRQAVLEHVMPAYKFLYEKLSDLAGTGTNPDGLCYFPNGKAYYEHLIRTSTGSWLPVAGIEKRIRQQLSNDYAAAKEILSENTSFSTSDLFSNLLSDPVLIMEELQNRIEEDFPPSEDISCQIKYVHQSLEDYLSPAFYLTPPIDNLKNHTIYINSSADYTPLELFTTLAHEGFPGHLYQNISFDQKKTPVRSLFSFGGYTEGWATYVEMLSYDYAADLLAETSNSDLSLKDIFSEARLQQLNRSIMLGVSSLLDICIHYHGFTLADTQQFLENLGFTNPDSAASLHASILEAPANYLKYYLGYLTFLDLRTYFSQMYPEKFQLKDFHEQILSIGPCQFPVLEKYLKLYYE